MREHIYSSANVPYRSLRYETKAMNWINNKKMEFPLKIIYINLSVSQWDLLSNTNNELLRLAEPQTHTLNTKNSSHFFLLNYHKSHFFFLLSNLFMRFSLSAVQPNYRTGRTKQWKRVLNCLCLCITTKKKKTKCLKYHEKSYLNTIL